MLIYAAGAFSMFYDDDMRTGCGWVTVAGAAADTAAAGAAGTTGAILEGATDVGTVVTATGVMMAPVGIVSHGTMSTTSYGRAMPCCSAIVSCQARISGLYSSNLGLIKHKSSLCPQGAPNALHHLQVYLLPQVQDALVAYLARMVGATTGLLAYAGYTG